MSLNKYCEQFDVIGFTSNKFLEQFTNVIESAVKNVVQSIHAQIPLKSERKFIASLLGGNFRDYKKKLIEGMGLDDPGSRGSPYLRPVRYILTTPAQARNLTGNRCGTPLMKLDFLREHGYVGVHAVFSCPFCERELRDWDWNQPDYIYMLMDDDQYHTGRLVKAFEATRMMEVHQIYEQELLPLEKIWSA